MRLERSFLQAALPDATFMYGRQILAASDVLWDAIDNTTDIPVSIDSRTLEQDDFFITLKGLVVDAHTFLEAALKKGASGALIAQDRVHLLSTFAPELIAKKFFIVVDNTETAFILLAKAWRDLLTCPVIGVTGSVGKTTTKEMLRSILKAANIPSYVSYKNYNTVIGVSYNLLRAPRASQAVVLEMGISVKGEMQQEAAIVRPDYAVITAIAHCHLEGLGGTIQAVSHEKRQIFSQFTAKNVGIIHGDQPLLTDSNYAHPIAKFGLKTRNQVQGRKISVRQQGDGVLYVDFVLKLYGDKAPVTLTGCPQDAVMNALAASTVAYFLKIPLSAIVQGLENYRSFDSRFQLQKLKDNKGLLLNDCYNANPTSMRAALLAFSQLTAKGPKIAVLGDMRELGDKQAYWHRQVGRIVGKVEDLAALVLVGNLAKEIARTLPRDIDVSFAADWQEAVGKLRAHLTTENMLVLVKASNGVNLENLVNDVAEPVGTVGGTI
jgi:UDP-N-acetylmuramoyl-tripeptide--D-alanyl-D-alanine ligase